MLFRCFIALIEVGRYKLVSEPWSVLSTKTGCYHPQPGVSASDFDFSSPKVMPDTIPEFIEQQKDSANKKAKIAKDKV